MYVWNRVLELPLLSAKITVTEADLYLLQSWNRYQQWLDTYSQPAPARSVCKSCREAGGQVPGSGSDCPLSLGWVFSHGWRKDWIPPGVLPCLPRPAPHGHVCPWLQGTESCCQWTFLLSEICCCQRSFFPWSSLLANSQFPKQGTVLCDGAGESSRGGLLSPLWWPHLTSPGAQNLLACSPGQCQQGTSSVPRPRNSTEISWIPLNSWL